MKAIDIAQKLRNAISYQSTTVPISAAEQEQFEREYPGALAAIGEFLIYPRSAPLEVLKLRVELALANAELERRRSVSAPVWPHQGSITQPT